MSNTKYLHIQHIVSIIKNAEKPNFITPEGTESPKALGFSRSLVDMSTLETVSFFSDMEVFGGIRSTQPTTLPFHSSTLPTLQNLFNQHTNSEKGSPSTSASPTQHQGCTYPSSLRGYSVQHKASRAAFALTPKRQHS